MYLHIISILYEQLRYKINLKFVHLLQTQQNAANKTCNSTPTSQQKVSSTTPSNSTTNTNKTEPKPVECNLCHRKFKNIPALNGHMRLHGGYFKKVSKTNIK